MILQCHLHFLSQRLRVHSRGALKDARTIQVRILRISSHAQASHEPGSVSATIGTSERTYA
jgi:hypothetical protein